MTQSPLLIFSFTQRMLINEDVERKEIQACTYAGKTPYMDFTARDNIWLGRSLHSLSVLHQEVYTEQPSC